MEQVFERQASIVGERRDHLLQARALAQGVDLLKQRLAPGCGDYFIGAFPNAPQLEHDAQEAWIFVLQALREVREGRSRRHDW